MGDDDCVTDRGTLMCKFGNHEDVLFWAMYNPNSDDEIIEGFDLVLISRALNSYVNIFNVYSCFWTYTFSI